MKAVWSLAALFTLLFMSGSALARQPFQQAAFPDVPTDHPNYEAIDYLRLNNIIQGYPDGTFGPGLRINRAEFVKIVTSPFIISAVRVNNCVKENIDDADPTVFFPDVPREAWFAAPVCAAKVMNFVGGYPDFTFKPANYISFVEAAKILTRVFFGSIAEGEVWYEPFVRKLADVGSIPPSISGLDVKITRGEMAEMIYRLKAQKTGKTSLMYEDLSQ